VKKFKEKRKVFHRESQANQQNLTRRIRLERADRTKKKHFLLNLDEKEKSFKTLTKIEGLKGLVRMLRSPAHIMGPTATAPTTTSGLFDSCHRKIRLIGGNPVAFLGGLMS
jgi:hypothetical protein